MTKEELIEALEELGVDISSIDGTGTNGYVTKTDLEKAYASITSRKSIYTVPAEVISVEDAQDIVDSNDEPAKGVKL